MIGKTYRSLTPGDQSTFRSALDLLLLEVSSFESEHKVKVQINKVEFVPNPELSKELKEFMTASCWRLEGIITNK